MERESRVVVGDGALSCEPVLEALERVLAGHGYRLEWFEGARTGPYGGPELSMGWESFAAHGTWVSLPAEPHRSRLATALARALGRPLTWCESLWEYEDSWGQLSVAAHRLEPTGAKVQLPTPLDGLDLDALTAGDGHERLAQLLHLLRGTLEVSPEASHSFAVFAAGAPAAPQAEPLSGALDERCVAEVLALLEAGARVTLGREDSCQFRLHIHSAPGIQGSTSYPDEPTATAIRRAAEARGLRGLRSPSVRG